MQDSTATPGGTSLPDMRLVLDSPRLRRIVVAFAANRLGTWFGLVALLVVVFDHTHSALAVSALLLCWQALPAFAVPALVARVESSARGRELSGLYFFEAVTTAAIALLQWHFWLPAILFLAALDGTAALASSALLRAALARAAREASEAPGATPPVNSEAAAEEAERKANALLNIAFSVTFVAGPLLAGVLVAAAGAATALFVDVASFLICGALLLDLHPHVAEAAGDSVGERLRAAWRVIGERPVLRRLLLLYALALALFETAAPIEVAFVKSTLHAGDRGLGELLTSWGAGAVLGSLLFAALRRRPLAVTLCAGTLGIGLADLGFAAAPTITIACLAAVIGGLGNGVELPSLMSLVQESTPADMHGRVIGAVESLTALAVAVGLPLGGALVALISTRAAFGVVGVATVLVAFALLGLAAWRDPQANPAAAAGEPKQPRRPPELAALSSDP